MTTEIEAARRLAYRAPACYKADEDCVTHVSMARLFATEIMKETVVRGLPS